MSGRLTAYLGVQATPETAGEIRAWADALEIKYSDMLRSVIDAGLEVMRQDLEARAGGRLAQDFLDWHVGQAVANHKWARARRGLDPVVRPAQRGAE